jgi:hypothetical protein
MKINSRDMSQIIHKGQESLSIGKLMINIKPLLEM